MAHRLKPSDLHKSAGFELIKAVPYSGMKAFVFEEIRRKSMLLKIYGIVQLIVGLILLATLSYFSMKSIKDEVLLFELQAIVYAVLCSFTVLIPIHEGIHAIAFLLLGKRDISFGAQWKKFMFYAESNLQVLSRKEMLFVALLPLLSISIICLILIIVAAKQHLQVFFGFILFIHVFFCSGDLAIVSFFQRHLPDEVFTYDSRLEKKTYYFKKITGFNI